LNQTYLSKYHSAETITQLIDEVTDTVPVALLRGFATFLCLIGLEVDIFWFWTVKTSILMMDIFPYFLKTFYRLNDKSANQKKKQQG